MIEHSIHNDCRLASACFTNKCKVALHFQARSHNVCVPGCILGGDKNIREFHSLIIYKGFCDLFPGLPLLGHGIEQVIIHSPTVRKLNNLAKLLTHKVTELLLAFYPVNVAAN